jgi:hypothetical protein
LAQGFIENPLGAHEEVLHDLPDLYPIKHMGYLLLDVVLGYHDRYLVDQLLDAGGRFLQKLTA